MDAGTSSVQLVDNTKPKYTTQYIAALSACLGSLCIGIGLGYSSPAGTMLTNTTRHSSDNLMLSDNENSWFSSSINIGAFFGGPVGGFLLSHVGRKGSLLVSVIGYLGCWLLTIFAQNFAMLVASRVVIGLSCGITCIAAIAYIGETASVDVRGRLGSGFQLMMGVGVLFVYVFGAVVDSWRILGIICGVPPVIFCIMIFFSKESPVYLLSKGKEDQAASSLQYFRGKHYDIQREFNTMKETFEESQRNKMSMKDLFSHSYLLKPLLISLALMFFQQFSGINAVLFNLASIFENAHTGLSGDLSSILVGIVQVLATVGSIFFVDRAGRKILLIVSASVMTISLVALGIYFYLRDNGEDVSSLGWLPLVSLMLFVMAFSAGYGPIPWLMMGELFPRSVAEEAGSLSTSMNWAMSFICTLIFEPLKASIHDYGVYWFFAAMTAINVAFCVILVPETKGKTIEEISIYFGAPSSSVNGALSPSEDNQSGDKKDAEHSRY